MRPRSCCLVVAVFLALLALPHRSDAGACVPLPASLVSQCQSCVSSSSPRAPLLSSRRVSLRRACALILSLLTDCCPRRTQHASCLFARVCAFVCMGAWVHGCAFWLFRRVLAPGTLVYVPDGFTIEQLDQEAAEAVGIFLLGLSSPSCTSSGVAFMCSEVFHACESVSLPDGSSGACRAGDGER